MSWLCQSADPPMGSVEVMTRTVLPTSSTTAQKLADGQESAVGAWYPGKKIRLSLHVPGPFAGSAELSISPRASIAKQLVALGHETSRI